VRPDAALKRLREVAALAPNAVVVEIAGLKELPSIGAACSNSGELDVAEFEWNSTLLGRTRTARSRGCARCTE